MDTPILSESSHKENHITSLQWVQYGLFWSWNLVFLAFMALGFAPVMLPETYTAVRTGVIPVPYLAYVLILALIPVGAVILGLTVLRRSPERLFALGYVIEGPLMLLLAVRLFAIRQATPGIILPMIIALLGMGAFLWYLLDQREGSRSPLIEGMRLAGLTLMAVTSLYAAAWIAFYALPISVEILRALGNFLSNITQTLADFGRSIRDMLLNRPLMLPFSILGFILVLYTATLFALTPIVVPLLSLHAWWRSLTRQIDRLGWLRPAILVCIVIVASAALFALANRQPQKQIFSLLAKPPSSESEAQALVQRSDSIRTGLLNAYLAPFRYISAQGEVRHVRDIYSSTFRMPEQQAFEIQRLYEEIASPFLYQPVHSQQISSIQENQALVKEPQEAAQLYQRFFDEPITDGERQTIVNAVRSTWSSDQAEAAWQVVDDREVHLLRQELDLKEQGDWADLELHEVYQNQTADLQEVIYYFNLPESAVLTGVWLGHTNDKSHAFNFQVAPRGAAQAVYREETRVLRDPALLEQVGPRQYRLRVYPVPRLNMKYDQQRSRTIVEDAPELHMWLSWREMGSSSSWEMPQLAYKRNIYWDGGTQRLINGQPARASSESWLPGSIPVTKNITPVAHRVDLPGDQTVLAIPAGQALLPEMPKKLRLAVVLDRSRSMQAYAGQVTEAIDQLKAFSSPDSPVDVYLTASPYRGEEPSVVSINDLDPAKILYYGGQNAAELIAQFEALRNDRQYQAVLVLTDGTGYELGQSEAAPAVPNIPVWIVHLSGAIPLGYDDQTLEAIQASGGGVAGDMEAALQRMVIALENPGAGKAATQDLLDGYLWITLPTQNADSAVPSGVEVQTHNLDEEFAALAARRMVLAEMQGNKGTISQLDTLDYLHGLATRYGIVTPYSSMIVLVDDQQQQLLDDLSKLGDRYQREVEGLGDTTPVTPLPLVGVPEPQEWLLIALAAGMLLYLAYRKRAQAMAF